MNYERDNKRSFGKRMRTPLLIIFLVVVLYSIVPGLLHMSLRVLFMIVRPAVSVSATLSNERADFFSFFTSKEALVEENASLRRQATDLTLVRAENQRLRETLSTFNKALLPDKSILATVIAAPPRSVYDTLLIDISQTPNVRQGMLVLSLDGAALGTVAEVLGSTAKVLLFSSSGVQLSGSLGASTTAVDLVGRGGGTFRATLPSHVRVEPGERITSAHVGGRIVALVETVTMDSTQLSETLDARLPVSLTTVHTVVLIDVPTIHP